MPSVQFSFTIHEILSLIALAQCVYILVYILFRSGDFARAILPFFYFLLLGSAFFLDFAHSRIGDISPIYGALQWGTWFAGPVLSLLLITQIARITSLPPLRDFVVVLFLPLSFSLAYFLAAIDTSCAEGIWSCAVFYDWLTVAGLAAGVLSMAGIFLHRREFNSLADEKTGRDRFWLIVTLIGVNLAFLGLMLASLNNSISSQGVAFIKTILGLGFVYTAGTSLFRIYPQTLKILDRALRLPLAMSGDEKALAEKIESLINVDKVYHENSFSRSDLARELKVPESVISRIINVHFGKTLPQLLNERRVEDAKRLLLQTDAPAHIVAREVGFNSTASFNRVFRHMTGMTPGAYRDTTNKARTA